MTRERERERAPFHPEAKKTLKTQAPVTTVKPLEGPLRRGRQRRLCATADPKWPRASLVGETHRGVPGGPAGSVCQGVAQRS